MAPVTRAQEREEEDRNQGAKITLYWLENSRAQRVIWLLEELDLEYELKAYKRKNMLAPAELKDIHPLGKSPILTITPLSSPSKPDSDPKPIVLAESAVIFSYLLAHFSPPSSQPSLLPQQWKSGQEGHVGGETEAWLRYEYYMHYAEGSLMPYLIIALVMTKMKEGTPFLLRPLITPVVGMVESRFLEPNLSTHLSFLESQLSTAPDKDSSSPSTEDSPPPYLCGSELSAADIMLSYPLLAGKSRAGLTEEKYPKLWEYVERLQGHEKFKKAIEKEEEALSGGSSKL